MPEQTRIDVERVHLQLHAVTPDVAGHSFLAPPPVLSAGPGLYTADQGEWDDALYADDGGWDREPDPDVFDDEDED